MLTLDPAGNSSGEVHTPEAQKLLNDKARAEKVRIAEIGRKVLADKAWLKRDIKIDGKLVHGMRGYSGWPEWFKYLVDTGLAEMDDRVMALFSRADFTFDKFIELCIKNGVRVE